MKVVEQRYRPYGEITRIFRWLDGLEKPPAEAVAEGPAGGGKTRAWGEFLYEAGAKWANTRILVVRKFRKDLHLGFQNTFESMVCTPNDPLLTAAGGGKGEGRSSYNFPNGSLIHLGHMEDAHRLYGSEWDIVFWNEMREALKKQWVQFARGLRKGTRPTECPFRLMCGDTNPDAPEHWANRYMNDGKALRIVTRLADNPYLEPEAVERLKNLPEPYRSRLYEGKWRGAEGQVWPEFDSNRHVVTADEMPEFSWYCGGMDFGYENPGCLLIFGVDSEGRFWCVREAYFTHRTTTDWAELVEEMYDQYKPVWIHADSAAEEQIKQLDKRLDDRFGRKARGVIRPVAKVKRGGKNWCEATRSHVRDLFKRDQVFYLEDLERLWKGVDPRLVEAAVARSTTEEIPMFTFRSSPAGREIATAQVDEVDPRCANHGCDATIYALCGSWGMDFGPEPEEQRVTWTDRATGIRELLEQEELRAAVYGSGNPTSTFDYSQRRY